MFSVFLMFLFGALLWALRNRIAHPTDQRLMTGIAMGGYLLRLGITNAQRSVSFFSHEGSGDAIQYRNFAWYLNAYWERAGVQYVSAGELLGEGGGVLTSAPGFVNLLALIEHLDDDKHGLGMVAINAFLACVAFLLFHRGAIDLGVPERIAKVFALVLFFSPAVLFHTSDTYKDPWIIGFGMISLYGCVLVMHSKALKGIALFLFGAFFLWFTRRYIIYMLLIPLATAYGIRLFTGKSRSLAFVVTLIGLLVAMVGAGNALDEARKQADFTYSTAVSPNVRDYNERGGSGVDFDDGGDPYRELGPKLAYTVFSPFLWSPGSVGFQIGKIDALIMTFGVFRGALAIVRGMRERKKELLFLLSFIIPSTFAYSLTMANIGLILRQRLLIEFALLLLAGLSYLPSTAPRRKASAPRLPSLPVRALNAPTHPRTSRSSS